MSDNSKPTQNDALSFELTDWLDNLTGGMKWGPPTEEDVLAMAAALRAVTSLHQPRNRVTQSASGHLVDAPGPCAVCDWDWPCSTIKVIQAALGDA